MRRSQSSLLDRPGLYRIGRFEWMIVPPTLRTAFYTTVSTMAVVLTVEVASYWTGSILQERAIMYEPQPVSEQAYQRYLDERDPQLGWPSQSHFGSDAYDERGARAQAGPPSPPDCAAAFGDSFTYGAEVSAKESWPSQLASLLGCGVANYGVSGYGTDQAYLRFLRYAPELPPIVLLGHFQEGLLRNVNQFHGFLRGGGGTGFKPRFVIGDDGDLELVPLPQLSYAQYREAILDVTDLLPHEYFSPGGPSGLQALRLPFTTSVLKSMAHYSIRARLRGVPRHGVFHEPSHPSQALEITGALLIDFSTRTHEMDLESLVVVLPAYSDFDYFRTHGHWVFSPLMERLDAAHVDFENAGDAILDRAAEEGLAAIFAPSGHYNALGNRIVAEAIQARLSARGIAE